MTTKFNSKAFKFADSVEITGTVNGGYDENIEKYRRVFRDDFPPGKTIKGRIIGISKINIGKIREEYHEYHEYDGYNSRSSSFNVFDIKGAVYVWKIALCLMRKPVLCLPDQIRSIVGDIEIPIAISRSFTKEEKRYMREAMKDEPRDSKGRWIKRK